MPRSPVVDQLSVIRQVHLVKGEVDSRDIAPLLPDTCTVTAGRWRVGIVHGHEDSGRDGAIPALSTFPKRIVECVVVGP